MVTVATHEIGRKKQRFADWSLPITPDDGGPDGLTLRKLISKIVREQVAGFQQRQADNQMLKVLTERQIQAGEVAGKILSGGSEVAPQAVDAEEAIGAALQAFEDGIYLVVIDDVEQIQLDAELYLTEDSRVTFVRLILLAGG